MKRKRKSKKKKKKDVFQPACFFCRASNPPLFLMNATVEGQDYEMILCSKHYSEGQNVIATINCNLCLTLAGNKITEFKYKQVSKKDFSHSRDKKTKEIITAFGKNVCDACRHKLLDYVTKHPKI